MPIKSPGPIEVAIATQNSKRLRQLASDALTNESWMLLMLVSDMIDRQRQAREVARLRAVLGRQQPDSPKPPAV